MNVKKIKDFLFRVKDTHQIQDEETYKRLTIRIRHQGVSLRDEAKGLNIGTKSQFWAKGGQFIVSKIDARWGAFGIIPDYIDKAIITGNFWAYEIDRKQVTMEWFHFFTSTEQFVQICRFASTGVTNRQYLDEKTFLNLEIPLPNLTEQETIVQKIKGFMATHSQAKAKIEALQIDLKAYRKSILQEAIKGNLTEEWRANNLTEKIDLKTLKKETTKKQKPLAAIKADEMPFTLPKNWSWVRLGDVAITISTGPFGTMLHKSDYVSNGIPLVNPMNIVNEKIVLSEKMMVDEATKKRLKSYVLKVNDIVIGRRGEMGRCAIVSDNEDGWLCGTGSFFLRLFPIIYNPFFIKLLSSEFVKNILIGSSVGATMNNLNHRILFNLLIPLPPLTEQAEIVRVLEEKMATITAAEEQLKALLAEQSQLQKSMMQEVFRG